MTVERTSELQRLDSALRAAASGRGAVVVLEGAAGAGKTHLVEASASLAEELGLRTLRAAGSPLSTDASFGLALELLEPLLAPLARAGEAPPPVAGLLAPDRDLDPDEANAALACLGLARVCEDLAAERPLALLVDDVHWADPASLGALAAISRRLPRAGIALVVALRLGEEPTDEDALVALRGEPPAEVLRLGPLSPGGVAELLESQRLGVVGDAAAIECTRITGGNPLLVTQVAAVLRDRSEPPTEEGLRRLGGTGTVSVAAAVEARLRRMGRDAVALVAACAVLGDDATIRSAAALAGIGEEEAVAAIDRLAAAGVLEPGEPLLFSHPLVRDAVYESRPTAARARDHGRAAALLAADGADPERVASQLLLSSPAGRPETVEALSEAAEQALARGVPSAAASYLERAVTEPPVPEQRARTMLRLGFAEALLGLPSAGGWLRGARREAGTTRLRAEADLRLGRHLYASGEYAEAERAFESGRAELGAETGGEPGGDEEADRLGAQLLAGSLAAARYAGTLDEEGGGERLAAVLRRDVPGESSAERGLLAELAVELGVRGEPRERVVPLAMRAWADGALAETSDRHGIVVSQVAAALVWSDAYPEGEAVLDAAAAHFEAIGAPTGLATTRYMRSWLRLYRGELAEALEDATAALFAEGWDMYRPSASSVVAHVHMERSELGEAAAALELPGGDGQWLESIPFALLLEARGRLASLRGEDREALRSLLACGERVSPMGEHQPYSRWRLHAALCHQRLGEPERARELIAAELRSARGAAAPRVLGSALAAAAALSDGEQGIAEAREAVEVLAPSGARLEHARALCRLGELLRRRGPRGEAREPLREALAIADDAGAILISEQAAAELTAAGGRPRRRALRGPDALTPAERRVARLAAAGYGNRAIAAELVVAEKTVQFHLTNAFRKLGVDSREQLYAAL